MTPRAGVVDGLLAGRYRLAHRLAAGGMGEVWRGRDLLLDREVAVKGLRPELVDDEDVRARFRAEARSAGQLSHPCIAAVYDFVEDDEGAWLVMELVDGEPLSTVLREQGRLSPDRTLDLLQQCAAALEAAHDAGVVHRDVKPGNLLVRSDGTLSVTDFGIAAVAGAASLTRTGQLVGTAGYVSPEQASGAPASPRSDLYALGVVAYECLAGRRPFEAENPVAVLLAHLQQPPPPLPEDVPPPVSALVLGLLAKDPADRPRSAGELAEQAARLRASLSGRSGPAGRVPAVAQGPGTAPPATTALPAVDPYPSGEEVAPVAPVPRASGLAGRPGQRRAVRATAVLLGLLAVALGVRGSLDDGRTGVLPTPTVSAPTPSATPSATPSSPPSVAPTTAPVPAAPAPAAPVQTGTTATGERDQPADDAPAGGGVAVSAPGDSGPDGAGQEAAEDASDNGNGRGNGDGNGRGNGNGDGDGNGRGNGNGNGNGRGNGGGGNGGR